MSNTEKMHHATYELPINCFSAAFFFFDQYVSIARFFLDIVSELCKKEQSCFDYTANCLLSECSGGQE